MYRYRLHFSNSLFQSQCEVTAAEELCCKLTYANSHQECQLEQSKKELEQVKRKLLDAQVAAKTKLSPSEDEASCTKKLKVSEQEVKMVCVYTMSSSMGRYCTLSMGRYSTSLMGRHSTSLMGRYSTSLMGRYSTMSMGRNSTMSMGRYSTLSMGRYSTMSMGRYSTLSMGKHSTSLLKFKESVYMPTVIVVYPQ